MTRNEAGNILMISTHGYVGAEPELGKPDTGGQVVFVLELAKRFSRLGYRVDLVTRQFEGQPEEDRINELLRVWRIPFGGEEFIRKEDMHDHIGNFVTNFLAKVKKHDLRYDTVNTHYWDAGWAGQRIAEELQVPHVHTPHSLGWWKREQMKGARREQDKVYRFDERIKKEFLVYRNCDHVIATSDEQIAILNEEYEIPQDHMTMIPPGIDESRFIPVPGKELKAVRERLGMDENDVYCVGRAATNKGYDLLIKSMPCLKRLHEPARLVLAAGANSERDKQRVDDWKSLAGDLGVADNIKWMDYIEDAAMADHYRAPGVFALPSRYEPFGMTAVEAMACGTPTVLTVHGGLFEQVEFGQHALFGDPKRPEEFAALLSMPLRYERLREKLSVEGARYARRQFGWTGIAKRTLGVFNRFRGRYDHLREEEQQSEEELVTV